jgi:pSer/pThr/pTyr-binding forkhead associated (FHA) protein
VHPTHVQEVEIELDQTGLIVGRETAAGIHLPYPGVSARHARLFRDGGGYRLEDLGSTNGTRLGGRKLPPHTPELLAFGDVFAVGGIGVSLDGEIPSSGPVPADLGTQTLARRLVHDLFEVGPPAEPARVVVMSGPGEGRTLDLPSSGRVVHIGRGEGCDLVLPDPDVSREHVAIERGPAGFLARDVGSKNGVEVGGDNLTTGDRLLHDGDVIHLGGTCLRFADPEDRYLRQLEAAPAEPAASPVVVAAPAASSRLPAIATAIAITTLLTTLGLVLALAFLPHL